ncbi:protein of unknown function DUF190 [Desulfatibacillum aliphaticivorans]|uniref:Uncharacterized protein n=1 Tax=Desulfatibacillum aliphaticivorans TaxID=218208 RepID=B8FMD0_DESAL|nr:DUF190 domain-containing protein [Desulfatibacillum aliphaticivorans]ACL05968.1 protein of unknown function DUF190 [Desulfatibacillum aliphaticivorans]
MRYPKDGKLLRIFLGETVQHKGMPLHEWIVKKARKEGLAGATVVKGILGYGANSVIHTAKVLRLSEDLPVVVEIVDEAEKIEAFLQTIDEVINEGMATVQNAQIVFYRSSNNKS